MTDSNKMQKDVIKYGVKFPALGNPIKKLIADINKGIIGKTTTPNKRYVKTGKTVLPISDLENFNSREHSTEQRSSPLNSESLS